MSENRTKSIIQKVGIGIGIAIGSIVILASCFLIYLVFFTTSIDTAELSDDLKTFELAYDSNQSRRDIPEEFVITESYCTISEDGKLFTYTFGIQNIDINTRDLALTLFFTDEYVSAYPDKTVNPFYRLNFTEGLTLDSGEVYDISISGVVPDSIDDFKTYFDSLAFEIVSGELIGRVYLPVEFK